MSNILPSRTIDTHKVSGTLFFLPFAVVLCCLLTIGCKSSDKSKSIVPFFGGGTQVSHPENEFPPASPSLNPAQPVNINEGPGPAVPATPVSSSVTSSSSNAYSLPDMLPSRGASPTQTYAQDNMTEVFDVRPGTPVNGGGSAGQLPGAYFGSDRSAGVGGTPSSSNGFGNPSTTGRGSDYGRTYPTGDAPYTINDTGTSSDSSYGGPGYGGATTNNRYYHGPIGDNSASLVPTGFHWEDGDYLADNGTMMRVINGKSYQLVQYNQRTPLILPDLPGESQFPSPSQPQIPQTSTQIQISTDYRTATQMTNDFGTSLPIPTYESLLDQQENGLYVAAQGVITVAIPAPTTTIIPENTPVETVSSLAYSEYSSIGAIKAPLSSNNTVGDEYDEEMQRSIWSIMVNQNHDLLIFSPKAK